MPSLLFSTLPNLSPGSDGKNNFPVIILLIVRTFYFVVDLNQLHVFLLDSQLVLPSSNFT